MTRIALITLHTPTATNCRGASALPFHLLAYRPDNVDVRVWSFNFNGCSEKQVKESESRLGLDIRIMPKPGKIRYLSPAPVRLFLPKPVLGYLSLTDSVVSEVREFLKEGNTALWIYGEDIAHLAGRFDGVKTVITTPDCEAMYYHRVMAMKGMPSSAASLLRYGLMYHRYANMAATYPTGKHIRYHLVGREDTSFLRKLNPQAEAVFIRHPHYDLSGKPGAKVTDSERIRILIAGRYDFTMAQAADEAFEAMRNLPTEVKERFLITFLGKGWENPASTLKAAGFEIEMKGFVEDYAAEVASHHIQLTPIAVGTGTKGKVLDAFANGLMVMGTPLALENIAVESGKECVEYRDGAELNRWLSRVAENPSLVNDIAKAGRDAVLREHGRERIAGEFYALFDFNNQNTL